METLKYIIEDSTIVELLGVQNFTSKESAVLELVKNAFDAKATELTISFQNDSITFEDNGCGMNAADIRQHWMHIGKSDKDYEVFDENNQKRVLAGSKGIGRFALSRLGGSVYLVSQKENLSDPSIVWNTDWAHSTLAENNPLELKGTKITISHLRDKWNVTQISSLRDYLSWTYNDTLMEIFILFEDKKLSVEKYFAAPKLGKNCISIFNLSYDAERKHLLCEIYSDEFKKDAKFYCDEIDINSAKYNLDIMDELIADDIAKSLQESEIRTILEELGNFSAEFYFCLKEASLENAEKFLYKYHTVPERYDNGIILYRNSFSISSYEGKKDWIGLGKRSRLSPAAATHPTGSWRVRENQLAGHVDIDKKTNDRLMDLSNRQGLDENIHYQFFVKIIDKGIAAFERYRQSIIRKVNKKNIIVEKEKTVVDKVINNPSIIKSLSTHEVSKFISEVREFKKENTEYRKEILDTEERYKYDIRILNVLATSGLKATSIAHEMHNDRNSVAQNCDDLIAALKKYDLWDLLNEEECTEYAYSNVPDLIDKNRRVNSKMVSFMDTMLTEVEKSEFYAENHVVLDLLNGIKTVWERDYAWVEISLNIDCLLLFVLSSDVIRVIFDNLILNSIQQNDLMNHLNISIDCTLNSGFLEFVYRDTGKGLDKKYLSNPMKILEVHETSRKRGHGLGMWIVNNTVNMSGGEIQNIVGTNGFLVQFTLGGKI